MVLLHLKQIDWLFRKWHSDLNWQHGFIIPLFSLYLLYSRRDDLFAARRSTDRRGLVLMILCLIGEMLAVFPIQNYWLRDMCMVGLVFGLVLYLGGGKVIRVTWLPILFLIFAMPLPARVYNAISLPLQNLAARGAGTALGLFNIDVNSSASTLDLVSISGQLRTLAVAQACNGMRLLMAFMALGVAAAYLDERPKWQRVILVLAAMPIAIFCNILRVTITCLMYFVDKEELGQKFTHTVTGLLMLVPAFALLWVLGWILKKLVTEEGEGDEQDTPAETSDSGGTA
jgi:exosortase